MIEIRLISCCTAFWYIFTYFWEGELGYRIVTGPSGELWLYERCPVTVRDLLYWRITTTQPRTSGRLIRSGDLHSTTPKQNSTLRVMTQIAITILTNGRWTTRLAHQIISSRKEIAFRISRVCYSLHRLTDLHHKLRFPALDRCFLDRTKVQLGLILPRDRILLVQLGKNSGTWTRTVVFRSNNTFCRRVRWSSPAPRQLFHCSPSTVKLVLDQCKLAFDIPEHASFYGLTQIHREHQGQWIQCGSQKWNMICTCVGIMLVNWCYPSVGYISRGRLVQSVRAIQWARRFIYRSIYFLRVLHNASWIKTSKVFSAVWLPWPQKFSK